MTKSDTTLTKQQEKVKNIKNRHRKQEEYQMQLENNKNLRKIDSKNIKIRV